MNTDIYIFHKKKVQTVILRCWKCSYLFIGSKATTKNVNLWYVITKVQFSYFRNWLLDPLKQSREIYLTFYYPSIRIPKIYNRQSRNPRKWSWQEFYGHFSCSPDPTKTDQWSRLIFFFTINLFMSFCTIFSYVILGWYHDNLGWKYRSLF